MKINGIVSAKGKSLQLCIGMALLLFFSLVLAACGENTAAPTTTVNPTSAATTAAATTTSASQATSTPVVLATNTTNVAATSTIVPTTTTASDTTASTTMAATTAPAAASTTPATTNASSTTGSATQNGQSSNKVPRFEAALSCPYKLPAGQVDGKTVRCGYVFVPEVHGQSGGKTIKLPVAIFKSISSTPDPEPIMFLEGGPGGPIQSIIDLMTGDMYKTFAGKNDVIMYDQRGAGLAAPNLSCPEFLTQDLLDANVVLTAQQSADHLVSSATKCHDRLTSQGINLSAYTSAESAADINDIRSTLGYQKVILYGSSYGTLLAQDTMRLFPQIIKSVVLDSVVPPDVNVNISGIATISRSFNLLFQACANDTTCNTKYPDLKNVFSKTVAKLDANPPTVKVTDPNTNKQIDAKANGSGLVSALIILLYDKDTYPLLPEIIYAIYNGNNAPLGPLLSIPLAEEKDIAYGMYFSVECGEDWAFSTPADAKVPEQNSLPELAKDDPISVQANFTLCQKWNVKKADPAQRTLVKSDIPTLVLEGQLDPVTPPNYGQMVANNLSKSFYIEFPANGHSEAVPGTPCSLGILSSFLANPTTKPDSSCTSQLTIKF